MRRGVLLALFAGVVWLSSSAWGQILFVASLDGSQETPPNAETSTGTAWAVLSADMSTLTYSVTYATLSSSFLAAHFHVGAPGVAGGVVLPLTFTGNTSTGTWSGFADSILTNLFMGNVYVNVHSGNHQGGEIRGQLKLAWGPGFATTMSAAQETPPTASAAMGTGWAILDSNGARITYRVSVAGFDTTVTAAHFHSGAPGVAGPVVHPIHLVDSTASETWSGFVDSIVVNLMKGNLYLNAHTPVNPGGAIRGQLLKVGPTVFTASLDGSQETPPDTTNAGGTGWAVLSQDYQTFTYSLTYANLSSAFLASHFHIGAPGVGGPVVMPITAYHRNTASVSAGQPPDSVIAALVKGNGYMNVHSHNHQGGEIRGQLIVAPGVTFFTTMTAAQETPPTSSQAEGTGWAILDTSGLNVNYHVTVAGLDTTLTAGHFHDGAPGVAGPVVHAITFVDSTSSGTWAGVPTNELLSLVKGNLYFNVHTPVNPGGAIRGQLGDIPSALTEVARTSVATPDRFALSQNYPNPFNPTTTIGFNVAAAGFVSIRVFDVLGRQVATLVNADMLPGAYTATFHAEHLASGVYFYRMEVRTGAAGSRLSQTFKMLLLK